MIQLGRRSCIIFPLFWYTYEIAKANKTCQNETCNRVRVGKYLSDIFPTMDGLKKEYVLSPVLLYFVSECAIRRVQRKENGFKLIDKHHMLVYADNGNIMG